MIRARRALFGRTFPVPLFALSVLGGCTSSTIAVEPTPVQVAPPEAPSPYPTARRGDVVDDYHGTLVADPYRWLEDPNSPETRRWIEAENVHTHAWLAEVPERALIRARLEELSNNERFGLPEARAGRYFFTYNDGVMEQSVLCRAPDLESEPEVVLDPNDFSDDGTVSLGGKSYSEDGRFLAYGLSDGGSDWRTYRIRDLETGEDLEEVLEWIKWGTPAWTHDNAGFFYARYPETVDRMRATVKSNKLYYHRLGTPQSEDEVVYEDLLNTSRTFAPMVTDDGAFLVIYASQGTSRNNGLYFKDLRDPDAVVLHLFDSFDASYVPIGNEGWTFWIQTDLSAPKGRVIRYDLAPSGGQTEVVPERDEALEDVSFVGGRLFATYLSDAKTVVRMFTPDGEDLGELALPGIGTASGFGGRQDDTETFYTFSSYTTPSTIFRYDIESGESTEVRSSNVPFDSSQFVTNQVFYRSKDGTRIPMFVTRARVSGPSTGQPTLLYGYGGFNISQRPRFSASIAAWLEMGGVYAVANIRGGGEYGRAWHLAGTLQNKQNVFDDFIAAAEFLILSGVTTRDRLAIAGGSNGGLLVAACLNQRPDLFGAALPAVGVQDMLRYHLFTVGWAWASDYGTADDPEMFPTLLAYSPLHNTKAGASYPPTLITTADHDDRVVPAHSFKYAAALQYAQGGTDPILIRIETRAGHGAGKSRSQRLEEATDRWAFLVRALDMQPAFQLQ
ncbi:MAG: S9 family peptidase [Planctomycetota bacterium]|nr:MAG: S9 family peptidase [Planctomycetota bacterium]